MGHTAPPRAIHQNRLATPNRRVYSIARAIPGKAEDGTGQLVFGNGRQHVCMVVLDTQQRYMPLGRQLLGILRGGIIRVQIAGDVGNLGSEEVHQIVDRPAVHCQALVVVQVAHVAAEYHVALHAQRYRVFQVAADRQHARGRPSQTDRDRRVTARTAQQLQRSRVLAGDGIIDRTDDRTIVRQHQIGDRAQPCQSFGHVDRHRLFGPVAAGADHRLGKLGQQQFVEWCGRQHGAYVGVGRRDRRRQRMPGQGLGASWQQQDRGLGRAEVAFRQRTDAAVSVGHRAVGKHHGKRFVGTSLSLAQPLDHGLLRGAGHQLESPQPLQGQDHAVGQPLGRGYQGLVTAGLPGALQVKQLQLRAAGGAGDWLSVKAPIGRVIVFLLAIITEREVAHRRAWPVVGQASNDRPAWPAVGAIGERIAVAALGGGGDFGPAIRADCQVRWDRRQWRSG